MADVNDLNVHGTGYLRYDGNGGNALAGVLAGAPGRPLYVRNIGGEAVTIRHEAAGSAAANRFTFPSASDLTLDEGDTARFIYDETDERWIYLGTDASGA